MSYSFRYPKEKFYINGTPDQPYLVEPELEPEGLKGFFSASPTGLWIDEDTGEIDINKSSSGTKYIVKFTPCSGEKSQYTTLIISGIGYIDDIYSLSDKSRELVLEPFFDGDVNNKRIPKTSFDIPFDGERTASSFKLAICKERGIVDLRETVHKCAFGVGKLTANLKLRPSEGVCKEFRIYYRHEEGEGRAINSVAIRLYYFKSRKDIPRPVLKALNENRRYLGLPPVGVDGPPILDEALQVYMTSPKPKQLTHGVIVDG